MNGQITSLFVDNIKIIDIKRLGHIEKVQLELIAVFKMVNMGPFSFYLRLKVERN